ncbi:MAG: DUF5689 domain-containing protein [Bacteroidetes bacterium]|nr:DUF5689 domain-containing protein [Bacteroidota bacterium]
MRKRRIILIYLLSISGVVLMLSNGCKKKEDNDNPAPVSQVPTVTTDTVSNITQTTATSGGNITSQGSSSINVRGVCWSTSINPVASDLHTTDGNGTGTFTSSITGLNPNTLYYARAYATNSAGTGYGNQVSFTTQQGTLIGIDSLKNWFYAYHQSDTLKITPDFIVEGIVSANDESGNIYKNLYFQDNTGGICISLDQTNLYTSYPVGQKIHIKCKDLYIGIYGTAIQIGYPYNGLIGRIPIVMIPSHLFTDGLPGLPPLPVVMNVGHLPGLNNLTSLLVAINSVTFPEAGQPFVVGYGSTSRAIADSVGNVSSLVAYTSPFATFSQTLLPSGVGTLQGILTVYNGQFEMIVRDTTDLINFHTLKKFH